MRLDGRDRGRILFAAVITVLALPTIWLVNRSDDNSRRPNVAAVGLDPGEADHATAADTGDDGFDPMGDAGAAYFEPGPTATATPPPVVAVGTTTDELVGTALGTYSHDVAFDICLYNGAHLRDKITVVNVANGRSTTCTTSYLAGGAPDEIVLNTERFRRIADLVTAPVHVEIHE